MEESKFIRILENAKASGNYANINLKVYRNQEHKYFKLIYVREEKICPYCKRGFNDSIENTLIVYFKDLPQHLTIFQASMLFLVFKLKKKPCDYAKYHKCPAGKKFIENIVKIEGVENGE